MIIPVILCGGTGSRLWPLSRSKMPKQLLRLTGSLTMFQYTFLRVCELNPGKIIVICNKSHDYKIRKQYEELCEKNNINIKVIVLTEPIGRNTAPAIACACFLTDKDDDLLVVPSDHMFDNDIFSKCVTKGLSFTKDSIVTLGRKPSYPEIGYGYIKRCGEFKIDSFKEKPDVETAKKYIEDGNYFWNSGVFLFKNKIIMNELIKTANDICNDVNISLNNLIKLKETNSNLKLKQFDIDIHFFSKCRDESIDYAVMEHIKNGIMIEYDGYWSDIGSWSSLYDHLDKDLNGNVLHGGDVIMESTTNSYIRSDHGLVATIGLDNLVIVKTRDSVLIANKNNTQDVKKIVNKLKEMNRSEVIAHAQEYMPWGWYINLEGNNKSGGKVKKICVYSGKRLSLQKHKFREEHWVIISGKGKVQVGQNQYNVSLNDYIHIPRGELHRIENIGTAPLVFIETQIGAYLGEDDIVRIEDDIGIK
jgi:mannose-1-phosphate guanylyltransferase/mannose-6-phosphate isomerase